MARQNKIGTHATSIKQDGDDITVRYHQTDVVTVKGPLVVLNTGGWFTPTTKTRINQAANQFGLGFSVRQKNYTWYVKRPGYADTPFQGDSISFIRGAQ